MWGCVWASVGVLVSILVFLDLYVRKLFKYQCRLDGDETKPQYLPFSDPLVGVVKGMLPMLSSSFKDDMFSENLKNTLGVKNEEARKMKVAQTWFAGLHLINVWNPELIREVLFDKEHVYDKLDVGIVTEPLLGQSILQVGGEEWKRQKRILGPAFHHDHIRSLLPAMEAVGEEMIASIVDQEPDLDNVSIHKWTTKATVEVIGRAGFGHTFHALKPETEEGDSKQDSLQVYENMAGVLQNPLQLNATLAKVTGYDKKMNKILGEFDELLIGIIEEKKAAIAAAGDSHVPSDILDLLVQAHDSDDPEFSLNDKQLLNNLAIFFVAGHETSASALASTVHFLAENPEAQRLAREEVDQAMAASDGGKLSYEQVCGLRYIKQCISETLRMASPAAMVVRTAARETTLGGYRIGKGTGIICNAHAMHFDDDVWEDPTSYKPERFDPLKKAKQARCTHVPFSVGPRQCLGNNFAMLEMRLFLCKILSSFDILSAGEEKNWSAWSGVVLQPAPKCRVRLVPRA